MSPTLDAALALASDGVHVFPLRPGTKVPATAHGVHDATTHEPTVRAWWSMGDAGLGIACGPSGLFVVDVDPRAEFASAEAAAIALDLPPTLTVSTPSGGWHFYFAGEGPNSVDKLRRGVDTRGIGGYVVAPPTPGYAVYLDGDPVPVPPAVLEALQRPARAEAHGIDAFDRRGVLAGVPEGRRQDSLFRYACSLRARGVDLDEAFVLLDFAATRCDPPFDAHEAALIVDRVWQGYDAPETPEEAAQGLLRPLSDFEPEEVEWFWHPRIPLGKLTVLAGVQGQGKSYVTAALAAAATTGRPLPDTGRPASKAGAAIIASYEDGIGDTVRWRMDRQGADADRVFVLPCGTDGRRAFTAAHLPNLERALDEIDARLLVIDPISSFLGGGIDGNSNEGVRAALEPLHHLAGKYGVAVVAVAHLNKSEVANALYRVSGANAFTAIPRSVLLLEWPDEVGHRRLRQIKNNLGPKADPLDFDITGAGLSWRFGRAA